MGKTVAPDAKRRVRYSNATIVMRFYRATPPSLTLPPLDETHVGREGKQKSPPSSEERVYGGRGWGGGLPYRTRILLK